MRFVRSALIGATAASLLAWPGAATANVASKHPASQPQVGTQVAAGRFDTSVRFLDFDHSRRYATDVNIRGQVIAKVGDNQGAVKDVRVRLYRRIDGNTRWLHIDSGRTNERRRPSFTFRARARANATYRVVFAGNAQLQPSQDATGVVVYRGFNARLEDGTGRFHGRVVPRYGHRVVFLEKRNCASCPWRSVARDETTDRGRYRFKVGAPPTGRYYWRLRTPPSIKYIRSYSSTFTTERR